MCAHLHASSPKNSVKSVHILLVQDAELAVATPEPAEGVHVPIASLQPEQDASWQPAEYQDASMEPAVAAASPASSAETADAPQGLPRQPTFIQHVPLSPEKVTSNALQILQLPWWNMQ